MSKFATLNFKRLQDPALIAPASFVASAISCLLLFAMLATRPSTQTPQLKEASIALAEASSLLTKGDFSSAYDMVMVASRLAPSDKRLFDLVIAFIEKANQSGDEEAVAMADDLADRGDSLVVFQSPENVATSRKRLTEVLSSSPPKELTSGPSPLSLIDKLLKVAENEKLSVSIRSKAVENARSTIDDMKFESAFADGNKSGENDAGKLEKFMDRVETAEKKCVATLFIKSKEKASQWQSAYSELAKSLDSVSPEL